MTSTSCRSSFEEEEEEEGHAKANNTSPPRKIRRSAAAAAASESFPGSTAMRSVRSYASRAPYFATTPLGFAANEFLPLKGSDLNMQSRKNLQQIEANKLSDDALGMCLFTGFLNSFEMVRLRSVNKRICRIASKQVHKLDLRKCENLTPVDIQNIVSSFHNLTVRFASCGFDLTQPAISCQRSKLTLLLFLPTHLGHGLFVLLYVWRRRVAPIDSHWQKPNKFGSEGDKSWG